MLRINFYFGSLVDYNEYNFIYNGLNEINWNIINENNFYGYEETTYYNINLKLICACSGCYSYIIDCSEKYQKLTRNYKNYHCMNCICKFCVCNSRRHNGQYDEKIIIYNWDLWCQCVVCKEIREEESIIEIQNNYERYVKLLLEYETKMIEEYKSNIINSFNNINTIKNDVKNIIIKYIILEIEPTLIVNKVHNLNNKLFD